MLYEVITPWEAMLIYSQVIEENKTNSLGDEVKLKKARLGYYMGNFSWAKAQLDVLKASTSKLTANDAMELSMMIGNNLNLDTLAASILGLFLLSAYKLVSRGILQPKPFTVNN